MHPEVSVVVPYWDAADTLDEALDSVLAQAGPSFEVVLVDDGSRDGGPALVARRAALDARVRPCAAPRPGGGIAQALAHGLAAARAPLIARMDADDVALPGRFARQVAALRADARLGAVGTRVDAFPARAVGAGLRRYVAWLNGLVTPEDHARQLFVEAPLCHPSTMLRREALDAVGGYRDGPWPEDYDLWLRLDAAGWRLAKLPDVLLRWRHRAGRATFTDPRYGLDRLRAVKAPHLARRLLALGRPVTMWGAGQTGKRLARALEPHGVRARRFVDVDPLKVGRRARGAPVVPPGALERGRETVVVAVGAPGARDEVRLRLDTFGFVEGADYVCAA